jgi:dihydropyrimidinase/dihydroorotase
MTADTLIKNCRVVRPEGISSEGIAIVGEKIAAVGSDDHLPQAERVIDAKGSFVIPGVIDPHTHPGYAHSLEEDTRVDSAAAAYGGVSTMGIMLGGGDVTHTGSYTEVFDIWKNTIEDNTFTDFVWNPMFFSEIQIEEISLYAERYGVPQFKMLLIDRILADGAIVMGTLSCDDGILYKALKQIAAIGPPARLFLHCENADVIHRLEADANQEENSYAQWEATRPEWVEALDIERAASIAKIVRAPIYIVHLSSAAGVDAVAKAKEEGVDIIAETCPSYLTLTKHTPLGAVAKVIPPLRDEKSIDRLWEAINQGIVECVGTDNISALRGNKTDIWTAWGGNPGIEHFLPIMLSEGVNKGRISLEKLVEVCCANNAKAMGIYPKKGVIEVGSDADLVVVDLNKKVTISAENDHMLSDYSLLPCLEAPLSWRMKGSLVNQERVSI